MAVSRPLITILLVLSALNLALMVPGGFVETRDFSAYPAIVLGAFNIFLTVLGLGSIVLAYTFARSGRGRTWSALAGIAYVAVYLLDIGRIFPVPPNPMSTLLATLEWIGTALGLVLAIAAFAFEDGKANSGSAVPRLRIPIVVGLVAAAIVIVVFATKSAMGV